MLNKKIIPVFLGAILVISIVSIAPVTKSETFKEHLPTIENNIQAGANVPIEPPVNLGKISKHDLEQHNCKPRAVATPPPVGAGKTIYVDDDFTDNPALHQWSTIQKALLDAQNGDTIRIYDGIYNEHGLVINKSITIIGNGSSTIINGENAEWRDIFYVMADNVVIKNLTIINAGDDAIEIEGGSNVLISNCEFYNSVCGIFATCSSYNTIQNCQFYNDTYGVLLANSVSDNVKTCNFASCIYGLYLLDSQHVKADAIIFDANNYGIYVDDSPYLTLLSSKFTNNTEYGFFGHKGENLDMQNCTFSNNTFGFYLAHGQGSILRNNAFNNNKYNFGNWGSMVNDFEWDVDTSNTINGKPIYYIRGASNLVFDNTMNIGCLILVSCDNIRIENITTGNNFNGIVLVDTEHSTIENCQVHDCYWAGIFLGRYSKYNTIENCSLHDMKRPVYLWSYAEHNIIANTTMYNASLGFYTLGKYNEINGCSFYNCTDRAIQSSQVITIENCKIWDNKWGIILIPRSGITLHNNSMWNNEESFGITYTTVTSWYNMNLDTTNTIDGKPIYYIRGASNLVFDNTMNIGCLILVSCDNITVRNISISHSYTGISLIDTTNSKVINCTTSYCHYALAATIGSENNLIKDCKSYNNSHGIFIYKSSGNRVENCQSYNNSFGLWIHYCPMPANVIRNTTLWNNDENIVMRGGSADDFRQDIDTSNTADGKPIYVIKDANNLVISGIGVGWLSLVNCTNITVQNMVFSHTDQALLLVKTTNSRILNCIAHDTGRGFSFYYDSNNNIIENCNSYNNGYGIYFYSSSDSNTIKNCVLHNNSIGLNGYRYAKNHNIENTTIYGNTEGILLYYHSDNNLIRNCNIYDNGYGIDLYMRDSNNEIQNSTIINNEIGIYVYYYSSDNEIKSCNISHNSEFGINLYKSASNLIMDNDFINNYYGVYLYSSSSGNKFYGNYFIDNAIYRQVRDNAGNYWDNGYPTGGNYWSDYSGKDNNGDGFGDTPYTILGDCGTSYAQDNYPIVNPPPISWMVITKTANGYISPSSILTIKGKDDRISGYKYYIHYRINGGHEEVGGLCQDIQLQFSFGKVTIEYWAVDSLGMEEKHHTCSFIVDSAPPSVGISFNPPATIENGRYYITPDTEISFNFSDPGVGNGYVMYSINNEWSAFSQPFKLDVGQYTMFYYGMDTVGNKGSTQMINIVVSKDFAPETTCNIVPSPNENGWLNKDAEITLKAIDKDGVKATYYRIDGGTWKEYSEPLKITKNGIHVIEFYSVDRFDIQENIKTVTVKIDKEKPLITLESPRNALYINGREIMPLSKSIVIGKLWIKGHIENTVSGIDKAYIRIDKNNKIEIPKDFEYLWDSFAMGRHEIEITVYNMAGSKSTIDISVTIINLKL